MLTVPRLSTTFKAASPPQWAPVQGGLTMHQLNILPDRQRLWTSRWIRSWLQNHVDCVRPGVPRIEISDHSPNSMLCELAVFADSVIEVFYNHVVVTSAGVWYWESQKDHEQWSWKGFVSYPDCMIVCSQLASPKQSLETGFVGTALCSFTAPPILHQDHEITDLTEPLDTELAKWLTEVLNHN